MVTDHAIGQSAFDYHNHDEDPYYAYSEICSRCILQSSLIYTDTVNHLHCVWLLFWSKGASLEMRAHHVYMFNDKLPSQISTQAMQWNFEPISSFIPVSSITLRAHEQQRFWKHRTRGTNKAGQILHSSLAYFAHRFWAMAGHRSRSTARSSANYLAQLAELQEPWRGYWMLLGSSQPCEVLIIGAIYIALRAALSGVGRDHDQSCSWILCNQFFGHATEVDPPIYVVSEILR